MRIWHIVQDMSMMMNIRQSVIIAALYVECSFLPLTLLKTSNHTEKSVWFYMLFFVAIFKEDRKIPPAEQIIANAV